MSTRRAPHLIAASLLIAAWPAHADALHGGPARASAMVGYATALSSDVMLRDELTALPGLLREAIDEGASQSGHVKSERGVLFMDWHVAGSLRVTGGMAFSRTRINLCTAAAQGVPMLGDVPHSTADDTSSGVTRGF